jgi:lipopolysaccharide/colanic/teichoic acid biosynthesis glycosyltransferase
MAASATRSRIGGFNLTKKRVFDLVLVCPLLLIAAPLMLLVAVAIWLFDGRPILFRQARLGRGATLFEMLKFRTMRQASDAAHRDYAGRWITQNRAFSNGKGRGALYKMTEDPRITRLGAILRRFSIDELPQLLNVVRGEMSLIGPRPALPYELELYRDWHRRRLEALPGLTGPWQVGGRNRLSFDEMVRLDIDYIEHWSLARDLAILARTPRAVLAGDGQ